MPGAWCIEIAPKARGISAGYEQSSSVFVSTSNTHAEGYYAQSHTDVKPRIFLPQNLPCISLAIVPRFDVSDWGTAHRAPTSSAQLSLDPLGHEQQVPIGIAWGNQLRSDW